MADTEISVGGRRYTMHCRDGEEADLARLAAMVDGKVMQARQGSNNLTEVRQLLFAALFLADELEDVRRQIAGHQAGLVAARNDEPVARAIEALAGRLEAIAQRLAPEPLAPEPAAP
jgi:cell division protein ZapA